MKDSQFHIHLHSLLSEMAERDDRHNLLCAQLHQKSLAFEPVQRLPVIFSYPTPADGKYQLVPYREIFHDPEKMLYNQLINAWGTSIYYQPLVGDDLPYTIRADFGTILIASLFHPGVEQVEDNPPWVNHDGGPHVTYEDIINANPADIMKGWVPRSLRQYEYYQQVLDQYPPLKKLVQLVLPDLQGPFDNLELILGSDVFTDFYEQPDKMALALRKMAEIQVNLARLFGQYTTDAGEGCSCQHGFFVRGNILLRNDSSIMVDPRMYRQQISTADEHVLTAVGGGSIHSCGNIGHLLPEYFDNPAMQALDFGQSELNDVNRAYELAQRFKKPLIRVAVTSRELVNLEFTRRFPTGVSLHCAAPSIQAAQEAMTAYRRCVD